MEGPHAWSLSPHSREKGWGVGGGLLINTVLWKTGGWRGQSGQWLGGEQFSPPAALHPVPDPAVLGTNTQRTQRRRSRVKLGAVRDMLRCLPGSPLELPRRRALQWTRLRGNLKEKSTKAERQVPSDPLRAKVPLWEPTAERVSSAAAAVWTVRIWEALWFV